MTSIGSEKKSNNDLGSEDKKIREPVFNVHKMPKGYKAGRFESEAAKNNNKNLSVLEEKKHQEKKHHSKKTGFLIVFIGLIVIVFLLYSVFSYIKNPEGFSIKLPSFNFATEKDNKEKIIEEVEKIDSNNIIENSGTVEETDDDLVIIEFDNTEENVLIEENLDNNIATSTEDFATTTEDSFNEEVVMSDYFIDTDNDGLNDEEEIIFSTNSINMDTDNDGYDDLTEILNLYNPAGMGDLLQNESIQSYKNLAFNYNVFYPKQFELKALSDGTSAIFLIDDQSFLQVLVEKNSDKKNIEDWYFSRFFETVDSSLIVDKNGWSGVYGEDFYSFYLTDDKKENVYSIIYSFPENKAATYYNVFRMMINSFELK